MEHVAAHQMAQSFKNNILQDSVATPFRCGGKFDDNLETNCLTSLSAKEFLTSVKILVAKIL